MILLFGGSETLNFSHLKKIIKIVTGEHIKVGLLNGNIGYAQAE